MADIPPTDDDPEDGQPVDQVQLDALRRQAQALGLHYNGRSTVELEAFLALARAEGGKDHPVACYGLSFEPTDRRCRICALRDPCGAMDHRPRVEVLDPARLDDVVCESCGAGQLSVELLAADSAEGEAREIRDYGCTTPGCLNTLGVQCGWEAQPERAPQEIAFAPKPERRLEGVQAAPRVSDSATPGSKKKKRPKLKIVRPPKEEPPEPPAEKPPVKKAREKKAKPEGGHPPNYQRGLSETDAGFRRRIIATEKQAAKSAPPSEEEPKTLSAAPKAAKKTAKASKVSSEKLEFPELPQPTPVVKNGRSPKGLAFEFGGKKYRSLSAIAALVTGTPNWAGGRFFNCNPAEVTAGQELEREYEGKLITVTVVKGG